MLYSRKYHSADMRLTYFCSKHSSKSLNYSDWEWIPVNLILRLFPIELTSFWYELFPFFPHEFYLSWWNIWSNQQDHWRSTLMQMCPWKCCYPWGHFCFLFLSSSFCRRKYIIRHSQISRSAFLYDPYEYYIALFAWKCNYRF